MSLGTAILVALLTVLVVNVDAQRWPLTGSCRPCTCSLKGKGHEIIKDVNCSNLNLTHIPSNLPTDMDVLHFSNNKLQSDHLKEVNKFPFLQSLCLAHNNVTTLDDLPFSKSSLLISVNFMGNSMTKLSKDAFRGLRNLERLRGLKVESADAQVFKRLPRLSELDLEIGSAEISKAIFDGLAVHSLELTIRRATKLPDDLFTFGKSTLKFLHIVAPKLKSLHEDTLQGLTFLKSIYLELPQVLTLSDGIFSKHQLSNLQNVQLISMQSLPSGLLTGLDSLVTLAIKKAEELPKALFGSLINLQELDLSQSFISQIPDDWFARLGNLVSLNISETSLRRLDPNSLTGLTQLKTLDVSGNSLRSIPKGVFTHFQNTLVYLDLSENILKNIETDALDGMLSLKTLDLSDNKMSSLQSDMFNDLIRLSVLNMQENMLSSLPLKVFYNQQRLSKLNLASNLFRDFPHALLAVSGLLINLDLSYNQISDIDRCLEDKFPFLELLSLKSNPINCDCNIMKMKDSHPDLHVEGICASPDEFKDQHIDTLSTPDRCRNTHCTYKDLISPTRVFPASFPGLSSIGNMASQIVEQDNHKNQHHGTDLAILFDRMEFKAIVGGVGGFIFICLFAVVVYVKKKRDHSTRYAVSHVDKENCAV